MKQSYLTPLLVGILAVPALAPATLAQTRQPAAATAAAVSDHELRAFAKVYTRYHELRETYETQINRTADAKHKQNLQDEGNAKLKAILQEQGLTADSYNRIFAAVNGDESLRQKALDLVAQERAKS